MYGKIQGALDRLSFSKVLRKAEEADLQPCDILVVPVDYNISAVLAFLDSSSNIRATSPTGGTHGASKTSKAKPEGRCGTL